MRFLEKFATGIIQGLGSALTWTFSLWLFWPIWERVIDTIVVAVVTATK